MPRFAKTLVVHAEGGCRQNLTLAVLQPLFHRLNISLLNDRLLLETNVTNLDPRIQQLQQTLDSCFEGECKKPEKWRAADVAKDLALSEGRFLHLFKQEMGIAWRPYLLWRRLLCSVRLLNRGRSATETAYVAGFSDSAHLSRTFRKMFGLSIRDASSLFR
ncbi:MAG: helix-turn-helix transcriptional regulator [Pseudohongiellaceae bacterium]